MAEIVNLRQFRKEKARTENRAKGTENAAKFGQTKAARDLHDAQTQKARRDLDGHEREPE